MSRLLDLLPSSFKQRLKVKIGAPHMYWSIENLKRNGFRPRVIADVGAFTGEFTRKVRRTFPDASFYMFEANPGMEKVLKAFADEHPENVKLFMKCLGSTAGQVISFHLMEPAGSVLEEHFDQHFPPVSLSTETLDNIFTGENVEKVDFIKLDVQGYELEVLKGFSKYLPSVDVVLMEVSLMDIHRKVPLFRDVVEFMYQAGFVAYDICSVAARRPIDLALWQTDLIFVKENSSFRLDKRY